MASPVRGPSLALDQKRALSRFDGWFVFSALVLLAFGLSSLYSKSVSFDRGVLFQKQVLNTVIGLVPFGIFATVHPKFWQRNASVVYVLNLLLLVAVLAVGKSVKGAERWVNIGPLQFQPSELAKLLIVLTLASFYAARQDRIKELSTFALGLAHVAVPMVLIFKQPHLGATMVVFVAWFAISLVAQVPAKFLAGIAAFFVLAAGTVFFVPAVADKVLHGYQAERIFGLKKRGDTQGRNYQTDRAEIAFGVGGAFGTGFLRGEQKEGRFIPEQHNDFIFTVIGEEGGLVGTTLVLLAYALFFWRAWLVMVATDDPYYRMLVAGVFAVLFFHTFVNIAMVLQLVPVVGLWLPFMSYGGTAIWLCMACVGLLINVRRRERTVLF